MPSTRIFPLRTSWGVWEAGAIAIFFSIPSLLEVLAKRAGRAGLDGIDWAIVCSACVGALVLTIVAKGLLRVREFLSIGLVVSFVWLVYAYVFAPGGELLSTYAIFTTGVMIAELCFSVIALIVVARSARGRLDGRRLRRVRNLLACAAICAGALVHTPLIATFLPRELRWPVILVALALCTVAIGVFAALVVGEFVPTPTDCSDTDTLETP